MTQRRRPGQGTTRIRNGRIQALIRVDGEQHTVGTFDTEEAADAAIADAHAHVRAGLDIRMLRINISDATERWLAIRETRVMAKTVHADRCMVNALPGTWSELLVRDITPNHVVRVVGEWADRYQKATAQRYKGSLGAFFGWLVEEGARTDSPVRGVTVPTRKHHQRIEIRPFSRAELDEVVADIRAFNPRAADQVLFLALTGARPEEARALRLSDLQQVPHRRLRIERAHPEGGEVGPTKTKKSRHVPLTDEAWEVAQRLVAGRTGNELLLVTGSGAILRDKGFRVSTRWDDSAKRFWKPEEDLVRAPYRREGWKSTGRGRRLYDLRHTAATLWLDEGLSLATVAKWLGHSSVTTTAIYTHWLGDDADRAAVAKLNRRRSDNEVTEGREA